jgi:hypothetical protein
MLVYRPMSILTGSPPGNRDLPIAQTIPAALPNPATILIDNDAVLEMI